MKHKKLIKKIFILLIIVFTFLFVLSETGYYESKKYKDIIITKEAMESFEEDIEKGFNVSIGSYLQPQKDFSNNFTKLGVNIGNLLDDILADKIKGLWEILKSLFIG